MTNSYLRILLRSRAVGALIGACAVVACGASDVVSEDIGVAGAALTQRDVLGFETSGAWSSPQGPVTSLSNNRSEGARALAVRPQGYVTYTSAPLSTLTGVQGKIGIDVWLPRAQPNAAWTGALQLYVTIPSLSLYNAYLGQSELTGLPLESWNTVVFNVPPDVLAKLRGSYADARFSIGFNVPQEATGTYLLDNLRFLSEEPRAITVTLPESPVQLRATKFYAPLRQEDGAVNPPAPVAFVIPKKVPVSIGNSANGTARLLYRDTAGKDVQCTYRGGSSQSHPTSDLELAKGRSYRFESCDNGLRVGADASGTRFRLIVDGGDVENIAKKTTVTLALGKGSCSSTLDAPIPPEESVSIRDGFSWAQTRAVPEADALGRPTLYYALIYLEDREQYRALDELLIHRSLLPIFDSELKKLEGQCGEFQFDGDGKGQFVYALLPGITYNQLRHFALTPDPVEGDQSLFRVVKLLDVPDARARNADGSVSFDALKQSGFQYMNLQKFPADDVTEVHQNPFFNSIRRRVSKFVAKAVRTTVRGIVDGLGEIDRFFAGSVNTTVNLIVQNRDQAFNQADLTLPGAKDMRRAWGPAAGRPIGPTGARVEILQWLQFGEVTTPFPTSYQGNLREDRSVTLRVAKNRGFRGLCVATTNAAAEITSFLTENLVCNFGDLPTRGFTQNLDLTVNTSDRELHALTAMTDSREYLRDVVHYNQPHRAEVLDGFMANLLGAANGGLAFTPCFDFPNIGSDFQLSVIGLYYGGSPVIDQSLGTLVEPYIATDMILPDQNAANFDSRGVVVHEYGHFALCSLLFDRGFFNVSVAYVDAMRQRMENQGNPGPDAQAGYINEAFADFFADQVVGGTNYFAAPNTTSTHDVNYCDGERDPVTGSAICLDTNFSSRDNFNAQIARMETTLHDAFDGHRQRSSNLPGDGDLWRMTGSRFAVSSAGYGDDADESVKLPGQCLISLINRWDNRGELLRDAAFLGGLSDVMRDPACGGASWCQACELFALHQGASKGGDPTAKWQICAQAPVRDWVGAPPAGSLNLDAASCTPCPIRQRSAAGVCIPCGANQIFSGGSCMSCPAGTAPVFGQDACCAPGEKQVNGVCVDACPDRQVFQNGQCVACAPAQIIVDDRCTTCPASARFRLGNSCVSDCDPNGNCSAGVACFRPDGNGVCQPIVP